MASLDVKELTSDYREDTGSVALAAYVPGSPEEKALVRKLDMHIVPCIWALYTMGYLDRANIGNARTGGMQADLGFDSNQYSIMLLVFFISYVLFEPFFNGLMTRLRPSIYLSALCFIWGGIAACMGACKTWQEVAAVRFILGIAEAGFAPGVAFYLSSWYKKHEIAKRFAIYYTATAISGAFSGLLAGVITQHLNGRNGIAGWRYLLILEGAGSCFVSLFTWYFLADWPSTTKWLSADEKILAVQRLASDNIASTQGESKDYGHWESFVMACRDWRVWYMSFCYALVTGAQTIQYFIPALVSQLGYKGYTAQYMTIPVYAVALVGILVISFASDMLKERYHFVTGSCIVAAISYIICATSTQKHVQFAFLCIAAGGTWGAIPVTLLTVPQLIPNPAEKRAIAIAIVNGLGNSASIYGSFLWPSNTAPRYTQGFATTTAFVGLCAVTFQVLRVLNKKYPPRELDREDAAAAFGTDRRPDDDKIPV